MRVWILAARATGLVGLRWHDRQAHRPNPRRLAAGADVKVVDHPCINLNPPIGGCPEGLTIT